MYLTWGIPESLGGWPDFWASAAHSAPVFRMIANRSMISRSWRANKLNEQSELKRAFQLALVLVDSKPCINVTVAVKGKLQRGWRRYTFGYSKDAPKAVQVELCTQNIELSSMIETLAADIARLNTLAVPEYTESAGTVSAADVPAGNDNNDNTLEDPPQL